MNGQDQNSIKLVVQIQVGTVSTKKKKGYGRLTHIYIYILKDLLFFEYLSLENLSFLWYLNFYEIDFFEKIAFKFAENFLMELEYHKIF